jgi:hypothetical protein
MFEFTVPTPTALEMLEQLAELREQRALALATGRDDDVADLDIDIAASTVTFIGVSVTEIATLRAELDEPLQG